MIAETERSLAGIRLDGTHDFHQAALLAAVLTQRPPLVEDHTGLREPITDVERRCMRAAALLSPMRAQAESLRAGLPEAFTTAVRAAVHAGDVAALAELGVDAKYVQFDDVVNVLVSGAPLLEIETVGPYAMHHVDDAGEIVVSPEKFPRDERAGIFLSAVLRDVTRLAGNVRIVALLDDFTTELPSVDFTQEQRDRYVLAMSRLLLDQGVLAGDDVPGRDYVLVRESEQAAQVDELLRSLAESGQGVVATVDGDEVFRPHQSFVSDLAVGPNRRREFRRKGILIRRQGRPPCQALDAAAFLHPCNHTITHLVMLDRRFTNQQDKTFALVRALEVVTHERYHNLFFDSERLSPEAIAFAVVELLSAHLDRFLGRHLARP